MLTQPTIEKLHAMRLRGMAEAFQHQQQDANIHSLSFEERLGLLIDRQWNWRQNRRSNDACVMVGCKARPVWKTSTIARHEAWIGNWCVRLPPNRPGCGSTTICS